MDINYVSIAGNPSGELYLTDLRKSAVPALLRAAGDLSHITVSLGSISVRGSSNLRDTTDTLKISGAVNLTVLVDELDGGTEDCVDINHSYNVSVQVQTARPWGKYLATIKASQRIDVWVARQDGHGSETDFDLGNWSDQSRAKTCLVTLHSVPVDGSAAKVRQLNADKPIMDPACKWKLSAWLSPFFLPVMIVLKKLKIA